MAIDITNKAWLAVLVQRFLAVYDPAAARLRLPPEVRNSDPDGPNLEARARALLIRSLRKRPSLTPGATDAASAFLAPIEGHIDLVLDLALLREGSFDLSRRQAEIAAFFAAIAGDFGSALAADPGHPGGGTASATRKALVRAGQFLRRQSYPPGDPVLGLPLYTGTLAIQRRHLARVAMTYFRKGQLERASMETELDHARGELAALVEVLAGLALLDAPLDDEHRRAVVQQVSRLGLPKETRHAALEPRPPAEMARAAPAKVRRFLVQQVLIAQLAHAPRTPAGRDAVQVYAEAAQLGPEQLTAMEVEAAAFHADQQRWLEVYGAALPHEWQALGVDWELMSDRMLERVAAAVTENLEAIVTEVKETGELGQLLAKAAGGRKLDAEEKRKVKLQLIDLAKAVPALAIFAAPGGMFLLPLLAKILPFNMLPSAWAGKDAPPTGSPGKSGTQKPGGG